ncbi:MAG: hypothetical protein HZB91_06795 [Elusimicrobia bacterium]|nr:hypothetical protein [Elusimicrobiota bacterium]
MKPFVPAAVAFFVLAGQGAAGQVVTRTQVPEVRLNVGPVAPTVNPAAGSGALGTMNSGMSFSGSVLYLRGGRIQEAPSGLPASVVPSLPTGGALPTPDVSGSYSPFLPEPSLGASPRAGAVFGVPGQPGQPFQRQALDPENPAMGQGSRGRLAGGVSEESSSAEFSEKAVAISRHLKEAGKVSEQGSEFAEGFGRRLEDLMVGSREHRSGGLEDGGLLGPGGVSALAGGVGLAAARGTPSPEGGRSPLPEGAAAGRPAGSRLDAVVRPSTVLDDGFPGVGRVLMEVSALTLDLSQVFPGGINLLAAKAATGASLALSEKAEVSAPLTSGIEPGRDNRSSAYEAADTELAYPGGFGSFMASVGGAMSSEGRGGLEAGTFIPLELKAVPAGALRPPAGRRPWSSAERAAGMNASSADESPSPRGFRGSRGFSTESSRLPSVPIALLSYALLPLFLAGLELRSRT